MELISVSCNIVPGMGWVVSRGTAQIRSFPDNMFSASVKIAMHDLANGPWDTKVSVMISWMQPGTNGSDSLNLSEI